MWFIRPSHLLSRLSLHCWFIGKQTKNKTGLDRDCVNAPEGPGHLVRATLENPFSCSMVRALVMSPSVGPLYQWLLALLTFVPLLVEQGIQVWLGGSRQLEMGLECHRLLFRISSWVYIPSSPLGIVVGLYTVWSLATLLLRRSVHLLLPVVGVVLDSPHWVPCLGVQFSGGKHESIEI